MELGSPENAQGIHVLIIEDASTDVELLIHRLKKHNIVFKHHLSQSEEETWGALQNHPINLVISDLNMPGYDGMQALRMVKEFDPMIPFILLSGSIDHEIQTQVLELGADEVIMKSNINRLPFAIRRIMHQYRQKGQLKLLESVVTNTNDAVMILEAEPHEGLGRKIVYVNDAFSKMTGYSSREAIGQTPHMLNGPKTSPQKRERLGESMAKWNTCEVEMINYTKSGEEFWVHIFVRPVPAPKGGFSHWICIERDITERIKREQQIRRALKEKTVLLSEVHHRVKNNLAVVCSLLNLERQQSDNDDAKNILRKAELRILSIANIHETLYKSEDFANLPFKDYLHEIIGAVKKAYDHKTNKIQLSTDIADIELNVNQAIPLGLIINELLTNTYKHAFPNQKAGTASISILQNGKKITLSVNDDGVGIPKNGNHLKGTSLGFTLIKTLVKQLKGKLSINNNSGLEVSIEFEKGNPKGSANSLDHDLK